MFPSDWKKEDRYETSKQAIQQIGRPFRWMKHFCLRPFFLFLLLPLSFSQHKQFSGGAGAAFLYSLAFVLLVLVHHIYSAAGAATIIIMVSSRKEE
jgi:hypothetical protein